jgi:hypothetical protein
MTSSKTDRRAVDQAREVLLSECARGIYEGYFTVRIRIIQSACEAVEAWFYFHGVDGWQRQPWRYTDRELLQALANTLDILLSEGQGDEWLVRRHVVSHGYDIDLQFFPDKVAGRLVDNLDLALDRLLACDRPTLKRDSCNSIRTTMQTSEQMAS